MITQKRFDRILRMLEDRAEYYHAQMLQYHDEKSAAVMTAYNSAIIMLINAEKGYDDLLDQFDYYKNEEGDKNV